MILFFDTETTGIRQNGFIPRVVQIGALLTDDEGRTVSELNVLLYPRGFDTVPQAAADVHGFTFDMLQKCGVDRERGLDVFFDLVAVADTIVAHNIEYDLDLLNIEIDYQLRKDSSDIDALAKGEAWKKVLDIKQQFCTMLNSRDLMKLPLSEAQASFFKDKGIDQKYKNPRLQEAHIHFMGYDFEGAHDAMADVRACKDVYFKLHSLKEAVAA